MKIEQKLILSNVMYGAFIILIGLFAFENMNLLLTKLRFVEIADDLNASFLEMRLSEKNYFLHHDREALDGILSTIETTKRTITGVHDDIIRAIGETDLQQLESYLASYAARHLGGAGRREHRRGAHQGRRQKAEGVLGFHHPPRTEEGQ